MGLNSSPSADGIALAGSVATSRDRPPVAAVVLVHGAGATKRYTALARLMALNGVAALTYDKRGVGQSQGRYEGEQNVSAANLRLLGTDAAAAMAALRGLAGLEHLPRGYVGFSQAGWVIPFALSGSPAVDFVGFWSGPACSVSEQLTYQRFSESRGLDRARMSDAEIGAVLSKVPYRTDDVDPLTILKTTVPVRWVFGGRDPYVPVTLSTQRLQARIEAGQRNWSFEVFPGEGHDLPESGQQATFTAMIAWIRRTVR